MMASVTLRAPALDQLMPMHAVVRPDGTIAQVGPTLAKVHAGQTLIGRPFSAVFSFRRAPGGGRLIDLFRSRGAKVHLRMTDPERTPLIGTAVTLEAGQGVLLNLSFGIAVVDAVARFRLAGSDFAATDHTVEMLYLVEAKSAAMEESRKLNTRLHGAKTAAEAEAQSDTLTGLRNRRALDQVLHRLIARESAFTLAHLDLDFFKAVNDTMGHAAGDHVLRRVARILLEETRAEDTVARVGGDEFVLVFHGLVDPRRLRALAGRIIRRLEEPIAYQSQTARISASIGMVTSRTYAHPEAERMLHDADIALYASKARGRACHTLFSPKLAEGFSAEDAAAAEARSGQ